MKNEIEGVNILLDEAPERIDSAAWEQLKAAFVNGSHSERKPRCETCRHDSINSHMCEIGVARVNRRQNDCMTWAGRIYELRFHFYCSEWEARDED